MHIHLLLEEESAEAFLAGLLPRVLPPSVSWTFHVHQGKTDLLAKLPARLRSYKEWLREDSRIVVLIDEDREDCHKLKRDLEEQARLAGLATRTSPRRDGCFIVLNRIAVEELEAWYFGDTLSLHSEFPRLPRSLGDSSKYRQPDAIRGGTWEQLERLLQRGGYYRSGILKTDLAARIGRRLDPGRNTSRSFQVFLKGIVQLASERA